MLVALTVGDVMSWSSTNLRRRGGGVAAAGSAEHCWWWWWWWCSKVRVKARALVNITIPPSLTVTTDQTITRNFKLQIREANCLH